MSDNGTDIGSAIVAGLAAGGGSSDVIWRTVGQSVADRLSRVTYYFRAESSGALPCSLGGTAPEASAITVDASSAAVVTIANAAMQVGTPNLAIWPAHKASLRLWTRAPYLPLGEKYGVLVTLTQLDENDDVATTIGYHAQDEDPYFSRDILDANLYRTDIALDIPQLEGSAQLRLGVKLEVITTCSSALRVLLYVGGEWASCIDTSLGVSGGGGAGTDDHEVKATATDDGHGPLVVKLKALTGIAISETQTGDVKQVGIACTVSPGSGPDKSTTLPLPNGPVAVLGDEGKYADGKHVHPLTRPSKIRYYLSDTHGTGDYTGHLLLTENPYSEANAIDFTGASEWEVFVSAPGSPGLSVWQGGELHAHLRVKLINPQVGRTYKLYTGNGDIVYTSMVWDWTHSDTYQVKESAPDQPSITTTYSDLDFDVPVSALSAGTDGRLGLNMRLRVYVGSSEAVFSGEKIVIRIGGDNASYLDTLFTPDGSFSGLHNDLDGRSAANVHPQESITPGRILDAVHASVTTSSGLFAIPDHCNFALLDGTEDIVGCSTAGWTEGSWMEFTVYSSRKILRSQTVPTGYAAITWGTMDTGYYGDFNEIAAGALTTYRCRLLGGLWRLVSSFNM